MALPTDTSGATRVSVETPIQDLLCIKEELGNALTCNACTCSLYEVKWASIQRGLHSRSAPGVGRDGNSRLATHKSEAAKQEYSGSSDRVRKKATTGVYVRAPEP